MALAISFTVTYKLLLVSNPETTYSADNTSPVYVSVLTANTFLKSAFSNTPEVLLNYFVQSPNFFTND